MWRRLMLKLNINFFILILLIIFIAGCSSIPILQESRVEAQPQYLEEVKTAPEDDTKIIEELQDLQKVEYDEYRIGRGNTFDVKVVGEPELFTENAIVKNDGYISLQMIGEVYVAGMTLPEAVSEIEKYYAKYLRDPKVSIIPRELKSANVTIMGKVKQPGNYEITSNMRVLDVIAEANGLSTGYVNGDTIEISDLTGAYLVRDNRILPVDFYELVRKGNMIHNIPVLDGDFIYIPSLINQEVYILGNVKSPSKYPYKENMTVMQMIAHAGGIDTGSYANVYIIRGGLNHPRVFEVSTKAILKGNVQDFPIKQNDIVYVSRDFFSSFNELVGKVLPGLQAIQSGWMIKGFIEDEINK
ncbi:MAG: polysaccharide biosynthesis/export protein [Candidatus Cloacimonadota bacterium]|nr:polysaccharide biosynthesis/export protein [Candidatus Cloacimonadota bacterium]